jgi:hypothetical protein
MSAWRITPFAKIADLLPGGLADDRPDSDFDPEALADGVEHETEHTSNPAIAKEIAEDHLVEDGDYYEKIEQVEKQALSPKALLGVAQNFARKVNAGTWQPSAVAQRLGITSPAARMTRLMNTTEKWIGSPQTGAWARNLRAVPPIASKHPIPQSLPQDAHLVQGGLGFAARDRVGEVIAEKGFGLSPRQVGVNLGPGRDPRRILHGYWHNNKAYSHGAVESEPFWSVLLHELGHARTTPNGPAAAATVNATPRSTFRSELLANLTAGRASRTLRGEGMAAPDSKALGGALTPALNTYRLSGMKDWIRSHMETPPEVRDMVRPDRAADYPGAISRAFPLVDPQNKNWYPRQGIRGILSRIFG